MATLQLALPKTSGIRMLEQPRQALRALVNSARKPAPQPRPSDIVPRAGESFTHLKLTAEKMLQEQACVKSDLEISNAKLQKAEEQLRLTESRLQEVCNENAMLRLKHKEDTKLWASLDAKFASVSAFFEQITETLHQLESQVQQAESSETMLKERLQKEEESAAQKVLSLEATIEDIREQSKLQLEAKQSEFELQLKEQSQLNDQTVVDLKQQFHLNMQQAVLEKETEERKAAAEKVAALEKTILDIQKDAELHLQAKQAEFENLMKELAQQSEEKMAEAKRQYEVEIAQAVSEVEKKERETAAQNASNLEKKFVDIGKESNLQLEAQQAEFEKQLKELTERNDQAVTELKQKYENLETEKKERECAAEIKIMEIRKQSELQLEAKQAEIAKHLKELSQRNDQAMVEMKRQYEIETKQAVLEMEKTVSQTRLQCKSELEEALLKERKKADTELEGSKSRYDSLQKEEEKRWNELMEKLQDDHKHELDAVLSEKNELQRKHEETLLEIQKLKDANKTASSTQSKVVNDVQLPKETEAVRKVSRTRKNDNKAAVNEDKKTFLKRKRPLETPTPKVTERKRPTPLKRRAGRSRALVENDLFAEGCLDPYGDDPYAFG